MFFHRKELMYDVKIQGADPRFGEMLLEQFGGATGELSAALTYWTQSFHVEDPAIRDMLHDIALEEFSHLEMVGRMIEQHTEKSDARDAAYKSTLFAVRGVGPHLVDSKGQAWTSAYVNEGGNVVRDLRADIAAEAGARQTYEALIKLSPDEGSKKALTFLLTREISHTNMFMKALEFSESSAKPISAMSSRTRRSTSISICPRTVHSTRVARGTRSRISNTSISRPRRAAHRRR